jgi:hypothetical protein
VQPLNYQTPGADDAPPPRWKDPLRLSMLVCALSLGGSLLAMTATFQSLWPVPPGSPIRPMGLVFLWLLIAFLTALQGLILGITAIIVGRHRKLYWALALLGIILSLLPLPASRAVSDWITARHSLIWEG